MSHVWMSHGARMSEACHTGILSISPIIRLDVNICVSWFIHICMCHDWFICVCVMIRSRMCVSWFIHVCMCHDSFTFVFYDSFTCVCVMTYSHVCVSRFIHICVLWLIHMCVCHDSVIRVCYDSSAHESWHTHTHKWVMSCICASRVKHMHARIQMCYVTLINESCHTCEWVRSHLWTSHGSCMIDSGHTYINDSWLASDRVT